MIVMNIWEIRNKKGIKLRALAELSGVSKTQLNEIENNKVSPTLVTLEKIAKALEVDINKLFTVV